MLFVGHFQHALEVFVRINASLRRFFELGHRDHLSWAQRPNYRNSIVHASWTLGENGVPLSVRFSARGEITRTRTPRNPEEILGRAFEAQRIAEDLERLAERLRS